MLTYAIIDILFLPMNLLLDALPVVELTLPEGVFDGLQNIFACLGWFPIAQLMPILTFSITLSLFQAVWALLIRVKSFIPTMGA